MSIEQNLGRKERVLRLALGVVLGALILLQPPYTLLHWAGLVPAVFLILNGLFGRCYLWHVLRLNSSGGCSDVCQRDAARQ